MTQRAPFVIGIAIVLAMVVLVGWFSSGTAELDPNLTEVSDPEAIANMVSLTRSSIATGENYFGHRVRVVSGLLTNLSDQALRFVEVRMEFTDYDGNVVYEGAYTVFDPRQRPIEPDTEYRFEVSFDDLPRTWNFRVPEMEVSRLAY